MLFAARWFGVTGSHAERDLAKEKMRPRIVSLCRTMEQVVHRRVHASGRTIRIAIEAPISVEVGRCRMTSLSAGRQATLSPALKPTQAIKRTNKRRSLERRFIRSSAVTAFDDLSLVHAFEPGQAVPSRFERRSSAWRTTPGAQC